MDQDPTADIISTPDNPFTLRQVSLVDRVAASPTLLQNPNAKLDPVTERRSYLQRQDPKYLAQLKRLDSQIGKSMRPETEAVVCIPVAGIQEARNIFKTLKLYSEQTLDSKKFELIVFVNAPESQMQSKKDAYKATVVEVKRAGKTFPRLNIRLVAATLPDEQVKIGNIRKIQTDLALIRTENAGVYKDILLLSNDADCEGLNPQYLEEYLKYFREHPDKEGAVGNLLFDPQSFTRFPAVHAKTEFVNLLDKRGFINGNVNLFGANSVMKSSIYSAIGGYPSALKTGEQEWTGKTIRSLRKAKGTLGYAGDGTVLITNNRRGLSSYLEGQGRQIPFGDTSAEAKMRALDVNQFPMFDYSNPAKVEQLKAEITQILNKVINGYEEGEHLGKNSWFYRTHLEMVGIQYTIIGDPKDIHGSRIVITDMSRFIERSRRMQESIKRGETNMATVYMDSWNQGPQLPSSTKTGESQVRQKPSEQSQVELNTSPDPRRQDKIIAAIVRGDHRLVLVDKVVVSEAERALFQKGVRDGVIGSTQYLNMIKVIRTSLAYEKDPESPVSLFAKFKEATDDARRMRRIVSYVTKGNLTSHDQITAADLAFFAKRFPTALNFEQTIPTLLLAVEQANKREDRERIRLEYVSVLDKVGMTIYGSQWVYLKQARILEQQMRQGK
ncbi:hypothetical protein HYW42_04545 [Candidatus Daviesbacteria bacterium]|nr:hypothetical protein [Candidatus Daviesbacteria bacterium]